MRDGEIAVRGGRVVEIGALAFMQGCLLEWVVGTWRSVGGIEGLAKVGQVWVGHYR